MDQPQPLPSPPGAPFHLYSLPLKEGALPLRGTVVDVETTGLPPRAGEQAWPGVVQMGAAFARGGMLHVFFGRCRILKEASIHPQALEVNGMSEAECRDPSLPTETEMAVLMLEWMQTNAAPRTVYGMN